jgi:hypothetical protein
MITYKGYTIEEGQGVNGVKVYRALRSKANCVASNKELAVIVRVIDELENN